MSYLEQRAPIAIVLGAFFALFLPLALAQVVPNFLGFLPYAFLAYVVGLGTTHFFVTLAVYLEAQNRAHFASSARNRLIYFAAPLAILSLFAWSAATDFRVRHAELAAGLFSAVRFFDFFHVGRQSVGMLQLFKRPHARALPGWLRRAENAFFVGMALLQWETFLLGGRFAAERWSARIPAAALGALALAIALQHARSWAARSRTGRREASGIEAPASGAAPAARAWLPLLYFALQAVSSAAAVYQTRLYLVALAMHYVEYHVIMRPRCFETPLDPRHALDRAAAFVRGRPGAFYALLLVIALGFELRNYAPEGLAPSTKFLVHFFDGIFFVHYFLEAFLWKFSDPFYRRTLAPLYLEPRAPGAGAAHRLGTLTARGVGVALLALLGIALARPWLAPAAREFERVAIAPLGAENHLRWGVELAKDGELARAQRHLREADRLQGGDPRTTAALRWVEQRLNQRQAEAR